MLLLRAGDARGAQRELRASAERNRAQGNVAQALWSELALAQALVELGELDAAQRLVATVEPALPPGAGRITPATVRATLRLAQGAIDEARSLIDAELRRLGDMGSAARAAALRVAVRVHAAAADAPRALQLARDAVAAAERIARDAERSVDVGEALLLLARAQRANGAEAEAAATARRAIAALSNGLGDGHALTHEALALAGR